MTAVAPGDASITDTLIPGSRNVRNLTPGVRRALHGLGRNWLFVSLALLWHKTDSAPIRARWTAHLACTRLGYPLWNVLHARLDANPGVSAT